MLPPVSKNVWLAFRFLKSHHVPVAKMQMKESNCKKWHLPKTRVPGIKSSTFAKCFLSITPELRKSGHSLRVYILVSLCLAMMLGSEWQSLKSRSCRFCYATFLSRSQRCHIPFSDLMHFPRTFQKAFVMTHKELKASQYRARRLLLTGLKAKN